jgi:hypothetical protein
MSYALGRSEILLSICVRGQRRRMISTRKIHSLSQASKIEMNWFCRIIIVAVKILRYHSYLLKAEIYGGQFITGSSLPSNGDQGYLSY